MTRTVIFDFYGTLVRPAGPSRTLQDLLAVLGVEITPEIAERWHVDHLDGVLHEEASASEDAYEAWERARWTGMLTDAGVDVARAVGIVEALRAQIRAFRVAAFPEALEVLTELRARDLTVAICSNWHWDLDSYLHDAGLAPFVHTAITSARVGARKPHPVIYDRTLAAVGAEPASTLFVGDSWHPDVIGPVGAGMRAAHVLRDGGTGPELPAGAHRVADLRGVLELL